MLEYIFSKYFQQAYPCVSLSIPSFKDEVGDKRGTLILSLVHMSYKGRWASRVWCGVGG